MITSGTKRKPGWAILIGLTAGLVVLAQACVASHDSVRLPNQSRTVAEALAQIDADLAVAETRLQHLSLIPLHLAALDEHIQTRLEVAEELRTQRCRQTNGTSVAPRSGEADVERLRCERLEWARRQYGIKDPSKETTVLLRLSERVEALRSELRGATPELEPVLAHIESVLLDLQTKYPGEHPRIRLLKDRNDDIRNRLRAFLKDTGESQWSVSTPSDTEAPVSCPGTSPHGGMGEVV
jgi:hypothetical protein